MVSPDSYARYSGLAGGSGGGGSGTVTSVGLDDASNVPIYTVSGSPVTTSGTLTLTLANQSANTVFAGPSTGSPDQPGFRAFVLADLPAIGSNTVLGNTTGGIAAPAAVALGTVTEATSSVLTLTGWAHATIGSPTIQVKQASGSVSGYLSSSDWTTFNGKQAAGNYITALTGDVTATGPGSVASSLVATTNGTLTTLSALTTASSLVTVGTITSGTWNGTTIAVANGGTGAVTLANHGVLIGSGTSAIRALAAAPANQVLLGQGTGSDPNFTGTPTLGLNGSQTGSLGLANGGGSGATVTIINRGATAAYNFNLPTTVGSAGQFLTSQAGGTNSMTWTTGGTVTSVTFTGDGTVLSSTPSSAVTTSGTLTAALNTQTANTIFSGPTSGGAANPTFRSQVYADLSPGLKIPTIQNFTSTGTAAGYYFIVTSANATVGTTYTNNGHTFTVLSTISSATTLYTSGASAPAASGTLTKSGGTGDSTITFSSAVAMASYTVPSSPAPLYIRPRAWAGGGGGGGGGTTGTATTGTNALPTVFITSGQTPSVAGGGNGGGAGVAAGQASSLGSDTVAGSLSWIGASGTGWVANNSIGEFLAGGVGGATSLGGNGAGSPNAAGSAAAANTGSGGGGGGSTGAATACYGMGGGAAGGGFDAIIAPLVGGTVYYYAIGTKGTHGNAGTSGFQGGDGADGRLQVEEHYQ